MFKNELKAFFEKKEMQICKIFNKNDFNARKIGVFFCGLFFAVLVSFLVEYCIFGYDLNFSKENNKKISTIGQSKIASDGFLIDEDGHYVSQKENSSLVLSLDGEYVNNLELNFVDNLNEKTSIRYVDHVSGKEIFVENRVQKNILKNNLNFLKTLVFKVENNPEQITVEFEKPQAKISSVVIDNKYHFNKNRFLFVFVSCLLVVSLFLLRKRIGGEPEKGFFAVFLLCGTLLVFVQTKSYISWDDFIHYKNVDSITLKSVVKKNVEDIYSKTNSVPHSYSIKEQEIIDDYFDNNFKKNISASKKDKKTEVFLKEAYNKVGYLPSALALILGRLLHLPYHIIFMFGRLANVLAFSTIVYFAIKKLKSGKMIMAVIALLPTSIFLASNYSYDYWVTAFTMLGFAYLFSEIQQPKKKISNREIVIMLGAFILGMGPKAIYFPLMFFLFLLKVEKFESLNHYKKFIFASIFSILFVAGSFLVPFVASGPGEGDSRGGGDVNAAKQVNFILSNPVEYSKILSSFMVDYINPKNGGGFVNSFAYLGSIGGFGILIFLLLFVTLTDKNKFDTQTSDFKFRVFMILIYLAIVALICTALYVVFTAVGKSTISGVQPRYLIPLLFPLLFLIGSSRIRIQFNRSIHNISIFIIMSSVMLLGVWNVIVKNYY